MLLLCSEQTETYMFPLKIPIILKFKWFSNTCYVIVLDSENVSISILTYFHPDLSYPTLLRIHQNTTLHSSRQTTIVPGLLYAATYLLKWKPKGVSPLVKTAR